MSLYSKYRPSTVESMEGSYGYLSNLLDKHCVFLFSGPSGVGKTTAARALANKLEADAMDIYEINASDNTSVEDMRNLLDNLMNVPIGKRYVVILDEAHKLSASAQEILNKPLEDGINNTVWFFCTTNPDKLSSSIRTRAMKIDFKPLSVDQLVSILRTVKKAENLVVSSTVLLEVATKAQGSARDALVLLETVSVMDEEKALQHLAVDETDVQTIKLCKSFYNGYWGEVVELVAGLSEYSADVLRKAVLGYCVGVLKRQQKPDVHLLKKCHILLDRIGPDDYTVLLVMLGKAIST